MLYMRAYMAYCGVICPAVAVLWVVQLGLAARKDLTTAFCFLSSSLSLRLWGVPFSTGFPMIDGKR